MSVNVLQERFLESWQLAGGAAAGYHDLVYGQFTDHTISVVCREGVGWVYDHVGDRHNEANGVKLAGEVYNALPQLELEERLEL